jgi:predicted membrane chloride channel (bestrophin family)
MPLCRYAAMPLCRAEVAEPILHAHHNPRWAYFHLLNMMSFLTLLLVSYCLVGASAWPVTVTVHAIICLIVLGMKQLAGAMADPFGDDEIDFRVEQFLASMYDNSMAHITEVSLCQP